MRLQGFSWMLWLAAGLAWPAPGWAQVDLDAYLKDDRLQDVKISPTGEYYAATMVKEDRTGLVIVRRATKQFTNTFLLDESTRVKDFIWVNDGRVVLSLAQQYGSRDEPYSTGELFGLDAAGGRYKILGGYRSKWGDGPGMTQTLPAEAVFLQITDTLPNDDRNVVVSVTPFATDATYSTAQRMDVVTGRRTMITRSPVRAAQFTTDNTGRVRFARGSGFDNINKLYYRCDNESDWQLVNDEAVSHRIEAALGFSANDAIAYLQVENTDGPDSIVAWDLARDERKVVLRDATVDPGRIIYRTGTHIPIGAMILSDRARNVFFDPDSVDAKQYRALEKALPEEVVHITSGTRDGKLLLAQAWSGNDPGQVFLYDTVNREAQNVFIRRDWMDVATLAQVQGISLKARDGTMLHGFITRPPQDSHGKPMPMVVLPHGGPIGVADTWGYGEEAQLLAAAGYAVLQVNYRGSSNYGRAFQQAGAQQWGRKMQDDLTDATRWAIQNSYADASRICIYGASYGAYAALMGVAKEPSLYKCAAGYVGVYDLPMMFRRGDTQDTRWGETYLRQWVGDPAGLGPLSPVNLADRIKVPVFLAAGGKDQRAPIQHTKAMEAALRKAQVPVQTLYYNTEGHGFYTLEHRREYYRQLLAFLAQSLGGQQASVAAAQP